MDEVRTNASVVLVAHDLNLSILKSWWLIKHQIIDEDELSSESTFSPGLVQIVTPDFEFIALPDRMQLRFPPMTTDASLVIARVFGGIVSQLPHTPYSGVGINFDYLMRQNESQSIEKWSSENCRPKWTLNSDKPNSRYGSYWSYDWKGFRAKTELKPVIVRGELPDHIKDFVDSRDGNCLKASFNFHHDIDEKTSFSEIIDLMAEWTDALQETHRILQAIKETDANAK